MYHVMLRIESLNTEIYPIVFSKDIYPDSKDPRKNIRYRSNTKVSEIYIEIQTSFRKNMFEYVMTNHLSSSLVND